MPVPTIPELDWENVTSMSTCIKHKTCKARCTASVMTLGPGCTWADSLDWLHLADPTLQYIDLWPIMKYDVIHKTGTT